MVQAKVWKSIRLFGLDIKEIPVKELFCKVLKLVSRLERDVHGKVSLGESFERKLAIEQMSEGLFIAGRVRKSGMRFWLPFMC